MPATIYVRYLTGTRCKTSATVQNKFQVSYYMYHEMSATINKCPVPYPEMLGTYPVAGIHETVRH